MRPIAEARPVSVAAIAADIIALTKPRLSTLVMITTTGGLWLAPKAPESSDPTRWLITILAVAAVVGAAQSLNCYIERESDKYMERTRNRPLPSGRLDPRIALWFGISLAAVSLPFLFLAVNPLTGALATIAFLSYVLVYTPLKRKTSAAMLVGGIPGALPPLIGWTAVTNQIDAGGFVLFAILYLWQIPHFIAIALFRKEEYARAGIRVVTLEKGEAKSRLYAVVYLIPLVAISVLPFTLGLAGVGYLIAAAVLGSVFLGMGVYGLIREAGREWARRFFFISLVYLTGLFVALVADGGRL